MRRHHYKAFDSSPGSVQRPIVTPAASLRLEKFSANSGGVTWHDLTANANNGTASDAAIFADFNFDGIVDNVQVAGVDPSADFTKDWSLVVWYKRTIPGLEQSTIFDTRTVPAGGSAGGYTLRDNIKATPPAPPVYDNFDMSVYNPTYQAPDMTPGTNADWRFAVVTFESGVGWKSYAEGVLFKTLNTANINGAGSPLRIGTGTYNKFDGYIDTVRVYPRLLSVDEITRDYNAGKVEHP